MLRADFAGRPVGEVNPRFAQNFVVPGSSRFRTYRMLADLRNGDPATFEYVFTSIGLDDAYHWPSDEMFPNFVVDGNTTEAELDDRIITEATIYSIRLQAAAVPVAAARVKASILATARVAGRRAWGCIDADIVQAQLFNHLTNVPDQVTYNAAGVQSADVDNGPTVAAFAAERAAVVLAFNGIGDDFRANTIYASAGMPPCNGATIVTTNVHHYVDPYKKYCDNVVEQAFGENWAAPTGLTVDDVKDIICHKAFHPWKSGILVGLARSDHVVLALNGINLGSATARLPAEWAPERGASALLALAQDVAQSGKAYNVSVNVTPYIEAKNVVSGYLNTNQFRKGLQAATDHLDAFKAANKSDVAWMAGFADAQYEASNTPRLDRSLTNARAVIAIKNNSRSSYQEGYDHYSNGRKWAISLAKSGYLAGKGIGGAKDPEPFGRADDGGAK